MDALAARVLRTIRRHEMLPPMARVAVAVSGGADSVAMLHLLLELQTAGNFQVAGVVHVHHGLRGDRADADEAFCTSLARTLSLPLIVERVDVQSQAARERRSIEDVARTLRYEALARAANALEADRVAVGHTRDDQAETVLLKLLRGAGTGGLAAIHPRNGSVIRPVLEVGRSELRDWLEARKIAFVEDETNADVRYRRNALRHRVMPVLRDQFGSAVATVLARHAEIAREDEAALTAAAAGLAGRVLLESDGEVVIDWAALREEPAALQRRVIRMALQQAGVPEPGLDHVLSVLEVVRGGRAAAGLPGGLRAVPRDGRLVLGGRPADKVIGYRYELSIPGSVWVPEAGQWVDARREEVPGPEAVPPRASPGLRTAVLDADRLTSSLVVRSWKPGDRLRPLGLGGRKKLQDLFVDRKVPAAERRRLPLVADKNDRIVWVPGHAIDESCRVTERTRAVLLLTMSESGGAV